MKLRFPNLTKCRFREDEDGGVLIEAILWLPLFFSLFVMIADASVLFLNQARIKKIMQDGSRQMAVGEISDCAALETWIENAVRVIAPTADATCTDGYLNQPTVSVASVAALSGELDLTGASGFFGGITVNISMVYHSEV